MPQGFFRRNKGTSIQPMPLTPDPASYEPEDLVTPFPLESEDNVDINPVAFDSSSLMEPTKTVDFAAAGRMKTALRTIIKDIDRLEIHQNAAKRRPGSTELRKKILETMVSCKQSDDMLLLGDCKSDDDDVAESVPNDNVVSNPDWDLSPQQVFDLTVSTLRAQIETMEERNGFIAHIRALEKLLDERRKEDLSTTNSLIELGQKYAEMDELSEQVEALKNQVKESQEMIETLKQERDAHHTTVTELSRILRSSDSEHDEHYFLGEAKPRYADVLTPDRALHLTICRLKNKVETLEDERHDFMAEIHILGATLHELKAEKEARELKITVLENQFEVMHKQFEAMETAMKEGPLNLHLALEACTSFDNADVDNDNEA